MPDAPALHAFHYESVTLDRTGTILSRTPGTGHRCFVDAGDTLSVELVALPGGSHLMGSPGRLAGYEDERPQHRVTVASFLLARALVTQALWEALMCRNSCRFKGPDLPVENVSRDEAEEFCRRLEWRTGQAFRLPSEAEWEWACRAGTTTPFSCGETLTTDVANYNGLHTYALEPAGVYRHTPTPAGTFPPNPFGLYDLHGNQWEWCADPWRPDYEGAPADGRVWTDGGDERHGVLRGGSWHDTPDVCRSAVRLRMRRDEGDDFYGFRLALSALT